MKKIAYSFIFNSLLIFLVGCFQTDKSHSKQIKEKHLSIDFIQRKTNETFCSLKDPIPKDRLPYPWENKRIGPHLRITKEFFRCKGNILNPPIKITRQNTSFFYHLDCGGIESHSLPIKNKKEFIYPILIDLLNFIQEKTKKKVIITCGHQCPIHNLYANPSKNAETSKHLIGAAVNFYVEEMEHESHAIVSLLMEYFQEKEEYWGDPKYQNFIRGAITEGCSNPSWFNQEILIRLYNSDEGRDFDNQHPYPYLSIEVRYDKETNRVVNYSWHQAYNGYLKTHLSQKLNLP